MAAGDHSKTWFDVVINEMKKSWSASMTWDEIISLCTKLTKKRDSYRAKNGIKAPDMYCPNCNAYHEFKIADITVGALFYQLEKCDLISNEECTIKLKEWKKYQRKNKLDGAGKPK